MFIRSRLVGRFGPYYSVIAGYRENGKVKHRVVANLGPFATVAEAQEYTQKELPKLRRALTRELNRWPDPSRRPGWAATKIDRLQRELAQHERDIERLKEAEQGLSGT